MGRRGPPPVPAAVKRARGTFQPSRTREDVQLALDIPQPPEWLDKEAQAEWDRVVPLLYEAKVLTRIDRGILTNYCLAWSLCVNATRSYMKDGLTVTRVSSKLTGNSIPSKRLAPHPMIRVAHEARAQARLLGAELGLSPSARTRITLQPPHDEPNNDEAFLFDGPKLVVGGKD